MTQALADTIGAPESERTEFLAAVGAFKATVRPLVEMLEMVKRLKATLPDVKKAQLPIIRAFINRCQTHPGCGPGIIKQLEWDPINHNLNLDDARPRLRAEVQRGSVRIMVKRPGFEAVNVYVRLRGAPGWTLLAERKCKFPYYDTRPLTIPGTPEVREYMAIGVVNDEETGQPSEVQEVVFAG